MSELYFEAENASQPNAEDALPTELTRAQLRTLCHYQIDDLIDRLPLSADEGQARHGMLDLRGVRIRTSLGFTRVLGTVDKFKATGAASWSIVIAPGK